MSDKKICALTFDDGPSAETERILDLLEKYQFSASFFVSGCPSTLDLHLETIKRAQSLGCTFENHIWKHTNLSNINDKFSILGYFYAAQYAITKACGDEPQFVRLPGCASSDLVYETIPLPMIRGYIGNDWNSKEDDPVTTNLEARVRSIIDSSANGNILLMHDCAGNHLTPTALEITLPKLVDEGFSFVNIREFFKIFNIRPQPHIKGQWSSKDSIR